ncbi:hypothetical protein CTheo_2455 [Ceratobasidium theobromae]|uniref:NADP-dependent oxidoreductase domain-containing protein n=1 Tax=Ceratobasidium theobromae TaxID=1582974 RepID=A0A5N5QR73_9AGAM|nr:hypothetical protein CTheo_2455 [Ceratobasidium theobromae]
MTMGAPGKIEVRNSDKQECQAILDAFFSHGHTELDAARVYGEGTTEEYLSQLNLGNAAIDTKYADTFWIAESRFNIVVPEYIPRSPGYMPPNVFAQNRSVPFEETLERVNEMYNEGLFQIFGLSNYASWEVAEIVGICKAKGYVQPKVYQAMYNAITRAIEPELVPCLRKFGLRLIIYNPLAGGSFAGKPHRPRFVTENYSKAFESLKAVAAAHNLRLTEVALRWCQHHSVLTPEDGIIFGASSVAQLEQNCTDSAKGPLPNEVVNALDEAWNEVGAQCPLYWR